ncbi:hypothetical protein [Sporolactobacillus pectinivorans]|uniref:hypothetical protein n=1 Tax=Sporolactobacillus pectinivorans TaxID=1591408 RepID=UPI000C26B1E3|nr:hypothetical protein [Sporolactobacillus pectinivorans]
MATINLRNIYPWFKEDTFVEVTDEMFEAMKATDRQQEAYRRRTMKKRGVATKPCPAFSRPSDRRSPAGRSPSESPRDTLPPSGKCLVGHILHGSI